MMTPRSKTMQDIAQIALRNGVTVADLISPTRRRPVVAARFECFELLRQQGRSLNQIGSIFNRDHTTVLHGLRRRGAA